MFKKPKFNLILLGPAGSGKGTQAELLVKKFGLQFVEAGDLVRKGAKKKTKLGYYLKKIHESGKHLPDRIIGQLIYENFKKLKKDTGVLVDGYPRTIGQAKDLEKIFKRFFPDFLKIAIYIKVSEKEATRRLLNRAVCPKCGKIFLTRDVRVCLKCGAKIEVRDYDQDKKAIKRRLKWFEEKVVPAINFYKKQKILIKINGEQSIINVFKEIVDNLKNFIKRYDFD